MQGFAQILTEDYADRLDSQGTEYVRRIAQSAARMDKLIQDVLNYSRIARNELEIRPIEIEPLLRGIIESYPSLQPPRADIRIEGSFPEVLGNDAGLTQCLSNLLSNAVKFVNPG